jgi:hypothetical protein
MAPNDIKSSGSPKDKGKDKDKEVDIVRLNLAEPGISNDGANYPHSIMRKLFLPRPEGLYKPDRPSGRKVVNSDLVRQTAVDNATIGSLPENVVDYHVDMLIQERAARASKKPS